MEKGSRNSGFDFDVDAAAHSSYIIQTKDRVDRNLSFGLETLTEYNSNRLNCNQILGSVTGNGTSSTHKKGVPSGSEPTVTWSVSAQSSDIVPRCRAQFRGQTVALPIQQQQRFSVNAAHAGEVLLHGNYSVSNVCKRGVRAAPRPQIFSEPITRKVGPCESRSASFTSS